MTPAEYDLVWKNIDTDRNGQLSLEELCKHYGYNITDLTDEEMDDDKILELLMVRAEGARHALAHRSPGRRAGLWPQTCAGPDGAQPHLPLSRCNPTSRRRSATRS